MGRHRMARAVCITRDCDEEAVKGDMCRKCKANWYYHYNQGPVHVSMWIQAVRLKVGRTYHLREGERQR